MVTGPGEARFVPLREVSARVQASYADLSDLTEDVLREMLKFMAYEAFDAGCLAGGGETTASWDFESWWTGGTT